MKRIGIILMLVCAIAAGALALTNQITNKIIEKRIQDEKIALLQELFPAVKDFEEKTIDGRTATIGYDANENVVGILSEGKTTGYGGDIRFNLGIDGEGKIVKLTIVAHSETAGLGAKIVEESYRAKYEGKTVGDSFDVENISGATISSSAMESGVESELKEILLRFGDASSIPTDPTVDITKVPDGTYEGEGQGLKSTIKVSVSVAGGKITEVKVISGNDTPDYFELAKSEVPARIVAEQSVQVDAASGATRSSKGIMDAVVDALTQ